MKIKKILSLICAICLLGGIMTGCKDNEISTSEISTETTSEDVTVDAKTLITDSNSINYGFNKMYGTNVLNDVGFENEKDIVGARFLVNGEFQSQFTTFSSRQDVKMEFYNGQNARFVNVSAGMAFTVPATGVLEVDYTLAKYRQQITLGDSILTVSSESSNPYAMTTSNPWGIYRDEWLLRWLNNDNYIKNNDLTRVKPVEYENKTFRKGYEIYSYAIKINDESGKIERPYYNIGVIRVEDDNINFGFFVMKSKQDRSQDLNNMLLSYSRLTKKGITKNYYDAGKPKANPNWNDETKEYYRLIQIDRKVNWGVFSYSMPGTSDSLTPGGGNYDYFYENSVKMQNGIEEAWGHKYEIYPTYTHIGYGGQKHYFPNQMALALAGGNGTNNKPVLQFTYQFTTDNNNVASNVTPLFDILRGKYDEEFKKLAQDIKAYRKPVLFRLNNEMNTDWTSYCGMITLCDPDIFRMTWQRLYNIFEEQGVDNCIWIWNPMNVSCPYSSWGEDLCYNPGEEYIQLLGLTCYQMNNGKATDEIPSFKEMYSTLYKKNQACWEEYRAIISEFACGSGGNSSGELGRNGNKQAEWVKGMFECFNATEKEDFAKQIYGAIWFNCNDGSGNSITNRLRFFDPASTAYDDLKNTVEQFRIGFSK